MILATDIGNLIELVWVSIVAAFAVALTFSLFVHGSVRATERSRAGRGGAATAYGAVAVLSGAAFAAGVAYALSIIISK